MRKPNYTEIYLYKNFFWLAIGVFGFVPVFNNFVLQLIHLTTDQNIAYGDLSKYIAVFQEILSLISTYVGFGVLAVCVTYFGKNARGIINLAFISHGLTFIFSLFTYVIYGGNNVGPAIFMLISDALINLASYFAIYLIILKTAQKHDTFMNIPRFDLLHPKAHPYFRAFSISALIFGGLQLITLIYTMIGDFIDPSLGPPVNLRDTLYWVFEYLTVIASTVSGFLIMLAVAVLAQKYIRSARGGKYLPKE